MTFWEWMFWISVGLISYSYLFYGLIITILAYLKPVPTHHQELEDYPEITLVIPAYNEIALLHEKWKDCQQLIYPSGKLHFLFVVDGSTDQSAQWLKDQEIPYLFEPQRNGKTGAMNRALQHVNTPLVAFCDANTRINPAAILHLVKHFEKQEVGAVSGEKRVMTENLSVQGEGLYWKYESFLKRMDSRFHTVVGAAGELFAIRKNLFVPFKEGTINDDLDLSLRILSQGWVIDYDPNAWAAEKSSPDLREEWKRKVRMNAGAWQAMTSHPSVLNFFKNPRTSFQFFSHRVLRWTLCPPALIFAFIAAFILRSEHSFYQIAFWSQCFFYGIAMLGWIMSRKGKSLKGLNLPYYFLFMHLAVFPGIWRWVTGQQSANWESVKRDSF